MDEQYDDGGGVNGDIHDDFIFYNNGERLTSWRLRRTEQRLTEKKMKCPQSSSRLCTEIVRQE